MRVLTPGALEGELHLVESANALVPGVRCSDVQIQGEEAAEKMDFGDLVFAEKKVRRKGFSREEFPRECGFFLWYNPELSERSKTIINELKKNNNKLKLEISELKKYTSYKGGVEYKDVLDDGNINHVIMQLSDEICSLNRKFRVAIFVVVCTRIVMMSMWLM
ncbi:hypothetical protein ZIOFF_014185 [Zingiber officinale]|uniref:Uncharacterized protein n=1 Tax=Zingiber officinale TaxID=94328 RepID=A0A8J5LRG2_ZINOF|nr:hypothetical protein ZIOFF_014185 [Zingiber officinale]